MDNPLIYIAAIGAIIVLAILLPRWVRRSTGAAGGRAGQRHVADRLTGILEELGTTLVLQTSEATAREIVDGVVRQQPRKFTPLASGGYGIRFVEPDDAIVRVVDDENGTRLQVERIREHLGVPNTSEFWSDLRSAVSAAARAEGVQVSPGPPLRHRRDDATESWIAE
ncbi:hypothetical protein BMW26_02675 [Microbacterium sp. 1.5R]|uniref:hypothetical protein n=1 Tax=Microbacterium TaxID=33882 RepID=UPI0006FCDE68|nr:MULTISPECIES: hypothetical protein [unclassified Microbacterium]APH43988.1 hypothetical protein BMW26_02675 [Microbacterium sp. 1.5R]KRD54232.1 hypothetical protein ASE34_03930 [Microbacterium sp. Root280D1]MDY0985779.1 hypothetical protein [Microbacterium sp. CFBP9023]CAH0224337.1 hypothetical protein SRABI98_02573 [Microbacterium sp. Bi98]